MYNEALLEKIISEMSSAIPASLIILVIGGILMLAGFIIYFIKRWDHPAVLIILWSLGFALLVTGFDSFLCARDILNNINDLPEYAVLKYFAHFD